MKKKNISKKVLAIFLSIVIIAMSVPFAIVGSAAGLYDPAPYFDDAAIEEGARAWVDNDGNVQVVFPSATAQPAYNGDPLSIAFYILELVDTGAKNASHTKVILDTIKVSANTRARTNSAVFAAADIGNIDLENKRYSVTVTAVDSENWFSQSIYTTVTDVPTFIYDGSHFEQFSTSSTAVREIMTFEKGTDDGVATGGQLLYMGVAQQAGTENVNGAGDTSALRFIMYNQPTGTQTFDTSYSRQTWDFKGAEEMWYWMDLTNVELTGLSFRLKTNEKMWIEWKDGTIATSQRPGETVYSTKGTAASTYTGEAPYVYVQREDGGWNKIMLKADGTVDLGNFKGYVRVPLEFICSETATYVDISNQEFGQSKSFTSGINNTVNEGNAFSWMAGMTFSQKVLVDNAGTSISDALLIHRRGYKTSSGFLNMGTKHTFTWNINGQYHNTEDLSSYNYSQVGYMLAMPLDTNAAKTSVTTGNVSTDRAYVSGNAVQNRAGGLKAIEDIYNAGFSIEGCSADSLQNSFFIDNIFFYRSDGGAYSQNTLDGNPNTGNSMSTYYDEKAKIQDIIFNAIDEYISSPDWADYREIEYILDMIDGYTQFYSTTALGADWLSYESLAAAAAASGRDSWDIALTAYNECAEEGTLGKANANKFDLVPMIIQDMEKLPAPETITAVSDVLRAEIVKLWQAYSLLNLGQLEMLGAEEEQEILKYFALVDGITETDGNEFVVGQQLADYPYIVYNDFEQNTTLGEKSWKLEDNKHAYTSNGGTGDLANDWRHLKSLVTYSVLDADNITGYSELGYVTTDSDKSQEVLDGKVHYNAAWATITNNGYQNSKAATVYSDSSFVGGDNSGVWHTVTISRNSKSANSFAEFTANNTGLDNLGSLAKVIGGDNGSPTIPLSIIFYVDFTEISDFHFTVNLFTKDSNGTDVKARVNMGVALNDDTKIANWTYRILNPETGEWVVNHTTNQWCFTSQKTDESWGDTMSLDGYKGYIMIPLYHIKKVESATLGVVTSETKMDENATYLNNIYAVQFALGGANMDEKSFTIDNVGFTYDQSWYGDFGHQSYAEIFNAKSLPAANFEKIVDEIDPYETSTLHENVVSALAIYNQLSVHQQSLVQEEKDTLDLYLQYVAGTNSLPKPTYTPEQLQTFVDSLPNAIKTASVTDEYDIPYPGFANGTVNYEAMGITPEMAAEIVKYYQESYTRYSNTQKASISNATEFLTAYNMAMRMTQTLEDIKDDAVDFLPKLTSLYERKTDDEGTLLGNFVSIEGREEVQSFWDTEYFPLQYYSKTSIDDGSIYANLTNTSRGLTYFLKNTETYTIDGEVIKGGLLNYQDKMQDIYDMAKDHIDNKTLFTAKEFEDMRDVLQEYNAFLQAYYNIEELYELEQKILDLFHVVDTEMGGTELMLSDEATSASTSYTISYVEYLDLNDKTASQPLFIRLKTASENGVLTDGFGNTMGYTLTMGPYTVDASTINVFTDAEWRASYPIMNNSLTEASPGVYNITASVTQEQINAAELVGTGRDEVTIEFVSSDGIVLDTHILYISYSMGDAYIVEIPADLPVDWEDSTPQDVSYSVTTEMKAGSTLLVGVTNDGTGKLKNSVTDDALNYEVANFTEIEFGYRVTDAKPDPAPTVIVSGWDDVPVGEYRTTLTYTVVYDDGTT